MPSNTRPPLTPPSEESADRLSRIWDATRPAPPSPELLDALWASASAEIDPVRSRMAGVPAKSDLVMPIRDRGSKRRRVFALFALGQAAALLLAVGFVLSQREVQPTSPTELARADAPTQLASISSGEITNPQKLLIDVGVDQTLLIRIKDGGHQVVMFDQAPIVAQYTQHDVFNSLESEGSP